MTDKELLELAAKAAGWIYLTSGELYVEGEGNCEWNPLIDDRDALRLAVKLTISIEFDDYEYVRVGGISYSDTSVSGIRRAIVLAAAEIGKGMS